MDAKMKMIQLKLKKALANFATFIFDKETKEVLGRTWQSWAKITGFFITLYAVLAGIFAIHLATFVAITPQPMEGVSPWNYGQYGYPNYPNSKIVLVSSPKAFTYRRNNQEAVLPSMDNTYIQRLLLNANDSGVISQCLTSPYGYNTGQICIFLHILKIHNWTPELFNVTGVQDIMLVKCSFESSAQSFNITSEMDGIPLNISNNANGRSFPFIGQNNYKTPVMAIQLNLTAISSTVRQGRVVCSVDLEGMGLPTYSAEMLKRHYEIPADSVTTIRFK